MARPRKSRTPRGECPSEVFRFDSVAAYGAAIAAGSRNPDESIAHVAHMSNRPSWYGAPSYEKALAMSAAGIAPTFTRIATQSASLTLATSRTRRPVFAVAGGSPVVPRVLAARPDSMRRVRRMPSIAPTVRFAFGVIPSCIVSVKAIEARGRAILAAADAVARAGHPVEVWALLTVRAADGGNRVFGSAVMLKAASLPMDWQRIAYWACHASAARCLGFMGLYNLLSPDSLRAIDATALGYPLRTVEQVRDSLPGVAISMPIPGASSDYECFALDASTMAADAIAAAVV